MNLENKHNLIPPPVFSSGNTCSLCPVTPHLMAFSLVRWAPTADIFFHPISKELRLGESFSHIRTFVTQSCLGHVEEQTGDIIPRAAHQFSHNRPTQSTAFCLDGSQWPAAITAGRSTQTSQELSKSAASLYSPAGRSEPF